MEAARRTSKTLVFWLVATTCIVAAASSSSSMVPMGSASAAKESARLQDLGACLSSLTSVEGCIEAIDKAVSNKTFGDLQHACCQAITLLGDNCWPIVFPDQPFVPFLLKSVCKLLSHFGKIAPAPY